MNERAHEGTEVVSMNADASTVALLNKSEIDQQVATAHRYPRSIKEFRNEALSLTTLSEEVASECSYALPRDGKTIEGPSARFAEVLASAWGNCRAGARVVDDRGEYIVAQGAFHDLQRNVAITYEVQRRVVDKNGRRFKPDMIAVTANAACSIALRNAILKGIPKALWSDIWAQSRQVAVGDATTLVNRRAKAIDKLAHYGVSAERVCAKLDRASVDDITVDDLAVLLGLFTAIREGDTTPEEAFPFPSSGTPPTNPGNDAQGNGTPAPGAGAAALREKLAKARKQAPAGPPASSPPPAGAKPDADGVIDPLRPSEVADAIKAAETLDELDFLRSSVARVPDDDDRVELETLIGERVRAIIAKQ